MTPCECDIMEDVCVVLFFFAEKGSGLCACVVIEALIYAEGVRARTFLCYAEALEKADIRREQYTENHQ